MNSLWMLNELVILLFLHWTTNLSHFSNHLMNKQQRRIFQSHFSVSEWSICDPNASRFTNLNGFNVRLRMIYVFGCESFWNLFSIPLTPMINDIRIITIWKENVCIVDLHSPEYLSGQNIIWIIAQTQWKSWKDDVMI